MVSTPLLTPTYSAVYAVEPEASARDAQPATAPLLGELTEDLYALLDCEWIIAWEQTASKLRLVSLIGTCPDLPACRAAAARLLKGPGEAAPRSSSPVEALFPVRAFGCLAGALALGPKRGQLTYTASDMNLLTGACRHIGSILELPRLASRVATNLIAVERTNRELQTAREVQNRFFPARSAAIHGIDYFGECHPSGDVGGDFFDFQLLPGGRLSIAVGDVSGKGIPAAIVMAGLQAVLRSLSVRDPRPAALVTELNSLVCSICPESFFATLFYAQIDPVRRTMTYVNAGHEPPLLLRQRSGKTIRPAVGGTVLGLSTRVQYAEGVIELEDGDLLIAVTDGVTEAANRAGEQFQLTRLHDAVTGSHTGRARDTVGHVMREVEDFAADSASSGDRTVIAVRILPDTPDYIALPGKAAAGPVHHA
jgi:phosphoserine phosphatase RsbU/P